MVTKKKLGWEGEAAEHGRNMLQALLRGDKPELKVLYAAVKGRDFLTALGLMIYHLQLLHDNKQKMDC